jgi:hypothetical protein
MSLPPDVTRVEDALRDQANFWRIASPRAGLADRVRAELSARPATGPRTPWFAWIPTGAALALMTVFAVFMTMPAPAPEPGPEALALASVPDRFARWPEWVDRANDPYRREWQAVAEDLAATSSFMVSLMDRLPSAN